MNSCSEIRRARPLLGTFVDIRIEGGLPALEAAFAAIAKVHALMSAQDPASDVGRLNRARPGEHVRVHPWTRRVLRKADELRHATGGLFDCRAGGCLTLDGIAKGFAVDQAVAALRAAGVRSGTVSAGGDLRVFGEKPERVHVRDSAGRLHDMGVLRDAAVASSDSSRIVDPRSGRACAAGRTISVVAADCMTADALTKVALLRNAE